MPTSKTKTKTSSARPKTVAKKTARKPTSKAKAKSAVRRSTAKKPPKATAKTDEAPKFGTPEWREKYAKKSKRKKRS